MPWCSWSCARRCVKGLTNRHRERRNGRPAIRGAADVRHTPVVQTHRSLVRRSEIPVSASRPVVTPIWPSVVYAADDADALDAQYEGERFGYTYAREGHPNAQVLAEKIDWMEGLPEGAAPGIMTGSGMAAISALVIGSLSAGDHVIAGNQLYGRTLRMLKEDVPRYGIDVSFVDPTDASELRGAVRDTTRLILLEVVSNPTLRVADMVTAAEIARETGALLAVDNTFTTPEAYKPYAHGADIIIHSVTKLLAGHSDATLGYISARDPSVGAAIERAAVTWGMTPSPFDCWLAERGLHSFALRYERAQATAARLADALAETSGVAAVLYPGRPDHPDHNRAGALIGPNYANMVSFRLAGGREEANRFIHAAPHIPFAPTLGDVGTTLSHPASSSHRGMTETERAAIGIDEGFFRVSVGIEDADQLIGEFVTAVQRSTG